MLIDWLTAYLPFDRIPESARADLRLMGDRIMRFCPKTGVMHWETSAWDSIRSDSHQISFRVGSDALWIQGSPARVCGDGCSVFGSGASVELDLAGCLDRMRLFVQSQINLTLDSNPAHWTVTRIDVTGNLLLDSLSDVRCALRTLRECEGGRYRVSQQAGDTVYWSHKSRLRSGKAYAKGPHIEYMMKKKDYSGRIYTQDEQILANRLLRLELKISSQYLRERINKPWHQITPTELIHEWQSYFFRMVGDSTMTDESSLYNRLILASKTEGQAKSAYSLYLLIKTNGWQKAREITSKPTWYRNLKVLHAAGLGDADIAVGNIVSFRRKILESQEVHSWQYLNQIAA